MDQTERSTELFNKYEARTNAASELADEVYKAVNPIIQLWISRGYKGRDIGLVIDSEIDAMIGETVLRIAIKMKQEERQSKL